MGQQFDFPRGSMPSLNLTARTVYLVIGVLAAFWLLTGIYTVEPDEQAVVLRFGKFQEVVEPGLHYHLPRPIEMHLTRSVRSVYRQEIGRASCRERV